VWQVTPALRTTVRKVDRNYTITAPRLGANAADVFAVTLTFTPGMAMRTDGTQINTAAAAATVAAHHHLLVRRCWQHKNTRITIEHIKTVFIELATPENV